MDHINCCNKTLARLLETRDHPKNFFPKDGCSNLHLLVQNNLEIILNWTVSRYLLNFKFLPSTGFLFLSVFYIIRTVDEKILPVPLPVLEAYNCCNYKLVSLSPPPPMPLTTPLPPGKNFLEAPWFSPHSPPPPSPRPSRRIHRKMAANWRENCAQEAAVRIFQILTHFPEDNDCLSRMQISRDAAMNADILATGVYINVEYIDSSAS